MWFENRGQGWASLMNDLANSTSFELRKAPKNEFFGTFMLSQFPKGKPKKLIISKLIIRLMEKLASKICNPTDYSDSIQLNPNSVWI